MEDSSKITQNAFPRRRPCSALRRSRPRGRLSLHSDGGACSKHGVPCRPRGRGPARRHPAQRALRRAQGRSRGHSWYAFGPRFAPDAAYGPTGGGTRTWAHSLRPTSWSSFPPPRAQAPSRQCVRTNTSRHLFSASTSSSPREWTRCSVRGRIRRGQLLPPHPAPSRAVDPFQAPPSTTHSSAPSLPRQFRSGPRRKSASRGWRPTDSTASPDPSPAPPGRGQGVHARRLECGLCQGHRPGH